MPVSAERVYNHAELLKLGFIEKPAVSMVGSNMVFGGNDYTVTDGGMAFIHAMIEMYGEVFVTLSINGVPVPASSFATSKISWGEGEASLRVHPMYNFLALSDLLEEEANDFEVRLENYEELSEFQRDSFAAINARLDSLTAIVARYTDDRDRLDGLDSLTRTHTRSISELTTSLTKYIDRAATDHKDADAAHALLRSEDVRLQDLIQANIRSISNIDVPVIVSFIPHDVVIATPGVATITYREVEEGVWKKLRKNGKPMNSVFTTKKVLKRATVPSATVTGYIGDRVFG